MLTGAAIFCQRHLCKQVGGAGGDYCIAVKANQARLQDEVKLLFEPPSSEELRRASWQGLAQIEMREAKTIDYAHGRIEVRQIQLARELEQYSDWPHLAQVCALKRTWHYKGVAHEATTYAITSLPPELTGASQALGLKRQHWSIENGLHHVKDVTLGEDASLIHKGYGPDNMSLMRHTVVSLLDQAGHYRVAAKLRQHSRHPKQALALMGINLG